MGGCKYIFVHTVFTRYYRYVVKDREITYVLGF